MESLEQMTLRTEKAGVSQLEMITHKLKMVYGLKLAMTDRSETRYLC